MHHSKFPIKEALVRNGSLKKEIELAETCAHSKSQNGYSYSRALGYIGKLKLPRNNHTIIGLHFLSMSRMLSALLSVSIYYSSTQVHFDFL